MSALNLLRSKCSRPSARGAECFKTTRVRVKCSATAPGSPEAQILSKPVAPVRPNVPVEVTPPQVDPWRKAIEAQNSAETVEVFITQVNKGGALVQYGDLRGFIPYSKLDQSRLKKGHQGEHMYLIGKKIKAKVFLVDISDPAKKKLVFSEKAVADIEKYKNIKVDDVLEGVVMKFEPFGAFVSFTEHPDVVGLLHQSEVSWSSTNTPTEEKISMGEKLILKVTSVDAEKCRMGVSLRAMSPEPGKLRLESLKWEDVVESELPEDMGKIVVALRKIIGVKSVTVNKRAVESSIATQELEAYLTKEETVNGFNAVLRLGTTLSEVFVETEVSRTSMKGILSSAIRKVLG